MKSIEWWMVGLLPFIISLLFFYASVRLSGKNCGILGNLLSLIEFLTSGYSVLMLFNMTFANTMAYLFPHLLLVVCGISLFVHWALTEKRQEHNHSLDRTS
ncbi:MAG: hypothetical protein PF795_12385 [Kiritimatiellae bacterium]|nr:hypothetical protein [Kiritimatiellia bacterium]